MENDNLLTSAGYNVDSASVYKGTMNDQRATPFSTVERRADNFNITSKAGFALYI